MKSDIIVIGGGASGMAAAICAARQGASVLILERMPKVGKKLLATGNGKCNFTNRYMNVKCYHSRQPERVKAVLDTFGQAAAETFFSELGILAKEKGGYVYPNSMQAASVLDALRFELERLRVTSRTNVEVQMRSGKRKRLPDSYRRRGISLSEVDSGLRREGVTKAWSNGSGYGFASSLGHSIVPVVPALTGLKAGERVYKALQEFGRRLPFG